MSRITADHLEQLTAEAEFSVNRARDLDCLAWYDDEADYATRTDRSLEALQAWTHVRRLYNRAITYAATVGAFETARDLEADRDCVLWWSPRPEALPTMIQYASLVNFVTCNRAELLELAAAYRDQVHVYLEHARQSYLGTDAYYTQMHDRSNRTYGDYAADCLEASIVLTLAADRTGE